MKIKEVYEKYYQSEPLCDLMLLAGTKEDPKLDWCIKELWTTTIAYKDVDAELARLRKIAEAAEAITKTLKDCDLGAWEMDLIQSFESILQEAGYLKDEQEKP